MTASVFWVIAVRVQEFDEGRGPVGFLADWAGFVSCPYSPIRVLVRVPLSNSGAGRSAWCRYPARHGCPGLGWLNRGLLGLLPVPDDGWRGQGARGGAGCGLAVRAGGLSVRGDQ